MTLATAPSGSETVPGSRWQHPPSFYCPISQQCMHDPVVLSDGHTYERRHIERWLQQHDASPVTGIVLPKKDPFPNHALRNAIEEYFRQVFSVHRRAIRKSLASPEEARSLGSNTPFLRTIDALMQCSLLMNADLSVENVVRHIVEEARALVGAEVASAFLVDHTRLELYSTVNSTGTEIRIPLNVGIAGHVAASGDPVVIHDAYADDRFDRTVDMRFGFKTRNMMCVPLSARKGKVVGVVQLINKTSAGVLGGEAVCHEDSGLPPNEQQQQQQQAVDMSFSAKDLHFLQVFATQAASAVVNSGAMLEPPRLVDDALEQRRPCLGSDPMRCSRSCESSSAGGVEQLATHELGTRAPSLVLPPGGIARSSERSFGCADEACGSLRSQRRFPCLASDALAPHAVRASNQLELLSQALDNWQLDVLELAEITDNKPLSSLIDFFFRELGFVDRFALDKKALARFACSIESGYHDSNSYHNRMHASSVMHSLHSLLGLGGVASLVEASGFFGDLERMSCMLAAAIHDYDHLGLTNGFLVNTGHDRAVLYNDQYVNEHHHAAAAFSELRRSENNFLAGLPRNSLSRLRSLAIDLVLSTDMADHGSLLKSFTNRLDEMKVGPIGSAATASTFCPAGEDDVRLLLKIAIKSADLGHVAMQWDTHVLWVERLETEFFAQGDQEKILGMPVSFLMDRDKGGPSSDQVGFFDFCVLPMLGSVVRAAPGTAAMKEAARANRDRWHTLQEKAKSEAEAEAADEEEKEEGEE